MMSTLPLHVDPALASEIPAPKHHIGQRVIVRLPFWGTATVRVVGILYTSREAAIHYDDPIGWSYTVEFDALDHSEPHQVYFENELEAA